jgi:hypothetical protein
MTQYTDFVLCSIYPCLYFAVPETDMRDSPWQEKSLPASDGGLSTTATGWSLPYILVDGFIICTIRKVSGKEKFEILTAVAVKSSRLRRSVNW